MLTVVVALVGLAALTVVLLTAGSIGRWLTVRALGVRGVPFPFGASARWCWTTPSLVPQALGVVGCILATYAASGALVAAGTWSTGMEVADETSMRVNVEAGGPAAAAGVQDGDRVDAVNGERVTSWSELRGAVGRHPLEPIDLSVTRDGREVHAQVTPDRSGLVRIRMPMRHQDATLGECLRAGAAAPAMFLYATARGVAGTLAGSSRAEVAGPVAIVRESERRSPPGPGNLVTFLGLIGAYMLPPMAIAALFTGPGRRKRLGKPHPAR